MNRYIWAAVGLVALAYLLMGLVKAMLPLLIVAAVLYGIYRFIFRHKW